MDRPPPDQWNNLGSGGLPPEKTPQIIMVTFDDHIQQQYLNLYNELLEESAKA